MNRSRVLRRVAALSSAVLLTLSVAVPVATAKPPEDGPAADKAKTTKVQILSLNDFHGQLRPPDGVNSSGGRIGPIHAGGAEYLASYLRQLEATNPNTLFVSAGDLVGATPLISAIFHDEPSIEAMNLMGLDYNGVGNHDSCLDASRVCSWGALSKATNRSAEALGYAGCNESDCSAQFLTDAAQRVMDSGAAISSSAVRHLGPIVIVNDGASHDDVVRMWDMAIADCELAIKQYEAGLEIEP